jgi:predicted CopG family antitoxin
MGGITSPGAPIYSCICVIIGKYMKSITLRDEVYHALRSLKREKERFSDVIARILIKKPDDCRQYAGGLRNSPILDEIEKTAREIRSSVRPRV